MSAIRLGELVLTRKITTEMQSNKYFADFIADSLKRYIHGDWGEVEEEDKRNNNYDLTHNTSTIFGIYTHLATDEEIWIITDWNKDRTTVLFPTEYKC